MFNHILFVCVHNAGRSQMAAAFLKQLAGAEVTVESAGTIPADSVNPLVVDAMRERGIDLFGYRPKLLTQGMVDLADHIITMGCSLAETCPVLFVHAEDWVLEDPAEKSFEEIRAIRDQIEILVNNFFLKLKTI